MTEFTEETETETLKAPYPYFGGKRTVAALIWQRFGAVRNYVEPFYGSGAVLLGRPQPFDGVETINDYDGFVANFWRAVVADPDGVARHADWPVNENDLHARHAWLVGQRDSLQSRLEGDPDFFDAKIAGWWCWGMCCWIGGGFCSGKGPWCVQEIDGVSHLVRGDAASEIERKRPSLSNAERGVNRQLVHLGDAGRGVNRQLVHLGTAGLGVNRKRVQITNDPMGVAGKPSDGVYEWMQALSDRLQRVRVCCGDWSRVCGPTPTFKQGLTAVFLDPPYADTANRDPNIYRVDCLNVAHKVREWAIANGDNPLMRICLAGYEGEHQMPASWDVVEWKARGGYGSQGGEDSDAKANSHKERLWFSPHCVSAKKPAQREMFS